MKKGGLAFFVVVFLVILLVGGVVFFLLYKSDVLKKEKVVEESNETVVEPQPINVSLASWDLEVFGRTKAGSEDLMNYYSSKIGAYDVVVIQNVVDSTDEAFNKLCNRLPGYSCWISSRAGRNVSKEQIGVIYKKGLVVQNFRDFNPDSKDRWERPPVGFEVVMGLTSLEVFTLNIKPEDASYELQMMQYVVSDGNVVVLGNLEADCGLWNMTDSPVFTDWNWVIVDGSDTTSTSDSCTYDRIIVNSGASSMLRESGIMADVTEQQSSHYLVWAKFEG